MTTSPAVVSRSTVDLTLPQRLVVAAHATTPFPRDAALVLSSTVEEFEEELHTIRQLFRAAGYATHTRQALMRSAEIAGQLPAPSANGTEEVSPI